MCVRLQLTWAELFHGFDYVQQRCFLNFEQRHFGIYAHVYMYVDERYNLG